jgi:hypothetical protein
MYDLKLWPNVPPDVKSNSSTLGKIEANFDQEQISNKNITTKSPPVIQWNDESDYPMLDELSRISKVREDKKKAAIIQIEFICS